MPRLHEVCKQLTASVELQQLSDKSEAVGGGNAGALLLRVFCLGHPLRCASTPRPLPVPPAPLLPC